MRTTHTFHHGECLSILRSMPTDSVDLTLTSPPYENARKLSTRALKKVTDAGFINGEFVLTGQAWVEWLIPIVVECCRVTRGLVCFVVEGRTQNHAYSCTPMLLSSAIQQQVQILQDKYPAMDIYQRKPILYRRVGIFGSGGPDWLRNDYELVLCFSKSRKLPWSDNTACGHPPKYPPGGDPSHRKQDGSRVKGRPYNPPKLANPGNIVDCHGGGGHMGSKFAHDNEAPFPEKLADFIIRSFCPPAAPKAGYAPGTVLDPFAGSGTVAAVAAKTDRNSISIDIRRQQWLLAQRRMKKDCHGIRQGKLKNGRHSVIYDAVKWNRA